MKMRPEFDDAPDFIGHLEQVVNGVVRRHLPETLVLIKVNNWVRLELAWLFWQGARGARRLEQAPQ